MNEMRYINCEKCGKAESMFAHEPRRESQSFKHLGNKGDEGIYECDCGGDLIESTRAFEGGEITLSVTFSEYDLDALQKLDDPSGIINHILDLVRG